MRFLCGGHTTLKARRIDSRLRPPLYQYDYLVEALCSLTEDGTGSTSISKIGINEGSIEIDSEGERLIILYSNDEDWESMTIQ